MVIADVNELSIQRTTLDRIMNGGLPESIYTDLVGIQNLLDEISIGLKRKGKVSIILSPKKINTNKRKRGTK